jgi:hypothetical protein
MNDTQRAIDAHPAYGPGLPHFNLPRNCPCGCCDEARNRFLHGWDRQGTNACHCHEYSSDERCDCRFCADMLRVGWHD